jgi:hypothetical protein
MHTPTQNIDILAVLSINFFSSIMIPMLSSTIIIVTITINKYTAKYKRTMVLLSLAAVYTNAASLHIPLR